MILLRLKAFNMYMFDEFDLDLTYKTKVSNSLIDNEFLSVANGINVKKVNILMGANSSGKTTLGKLICLVYNYLMGRSIKDFPREEMNNHIFDNEKDYGFLVEFVINNEAYALEAVFDKDGLKKEVLYNHKIYKTYNTAKLRKKLYNVESIVSEYNIDDREIMEYFKSYILNSKDFEIYTKRIKDNIGYYFLFSDYTEDNKDRIDIVADINIMEKLIKILDPSVEKLSYLVERNEDEEVVGPSYYIYFKNGEKTLVPDGKPNQIRQERISHGTSEALVFVSIIADMLKRDKELFFIDEKLTHVHTELEKFLLMQIITNLDENTQVFYTTHNTDCLELNLPMHSFTFMRRNEQGFNEIVHPELKLNKNDRNLLNYVKNNYFNTLPEFDELDLFSNDEK